MFKNATIYRIAGLQAAMNSGSSLHELLAPGAFLPCGATQPVSFGWVPPRGEKHAPLVEVIGGNMLLKIMTEAKVLPGDAVARRVEEWCKRIEDQTGRKPGKKQKKEIKEEVMLELLPTALARRSTLNLWIDFDRSLLVIDSASMSKADDAVSALVRWVAGVVVAPVLTAYSPAHAMANWLLSGEAPQNFSVDRECELKSADEMRSVVRYGRHSLDNDEVRSHITSGKVPTRLALTWNGRVSFVLTDASALRKLTFLEGVFADGKAGAAVDAFNADVAISTGELQRLIADLVDALGGERPAMEIVDEAKPDDASAAHSGDGPDPLLSKARAIVLETKRASISTVQRHLQIGYNRAARLLETLESQGVVSAMQTNGQRELLLTA